MPYGEGWLEKGVQFGALFINYIAFGIKPNIFVSYGALNENKSVPYGTLEENTNG